MRILVTGSRDWTDRQAIFRALWEIEERRLWLGIVNPKDMELVSGHSGNTDLWAEEIAEGLGWTVRRYPADWVGPCRDECQPRHRRPQRNGNGTYCPAAGNYRNQDMVDLGADEVRAFQRNHSRGTQDCITRARAAGLIIFLVEER